MWDISIIFIFKTNLRILISYTRSIFNLCTFMNFLDFLDYWCTWFCILILGIYELKFKREYLITVHSHCKWIVWNGCKFNTYIVIQENIWNHHNLDNLVPSLRIVKRLRLNYSGKKNIHCIHFLTPSCRISFLCTNVSMENVSYYFSIQIFLI